MQNLIDFLLNYQLIFFVTNYDFFNFPCDKIKLYKDAAKIFNFMNNDL